MSDFRPGELNSDVGLLALYGITEKEFGLQPIGLIILNRKPDIKPGEPNADVGLLALCMPGFRPGVESFSPFPHQTTKHEGPLP